MPKITTIVPPFVADRIQVQEFYFETQQELLEIDYVKSFRIRMNDTLDLHFHQYSLKGDILMVETFGGKFAHEIAIIDDVRFLTLPKWTGNEENSN